jgi:deferrochelatase/peroxidase EfeB
LDHSRRTTEPEPQAPATTRRRDLIRGALAVGVGGAAGLMAGRVTADDTVATAPASDLLEQAAPVVATGVHQAGLDRPHTPQSHGVLVAVDLPDIPPPGAGGIAFGDRIRGLCRALGETITTLAAGEPTDPDGTRDLTATVGLGPRVIAALDPDLPGAEALPRFAGDDLIPAEWTGGDLLIATYGGDPNHVRQSAHGLVGTVPGASPRWSQRVFRAPGVGTVARNPLGFHDGIIVPHGDAEMAQHVWLPDGPMAGGSICVVRRLRLDVEAFTTTSVPHQEEVIGRHRHDGSPLSGGGTTDEVDLLAKTPDGRYLTPARSHTRAAHPAFTGSELMLRRGYAYDDGVRDGVTDAGLMFVCFQRDLRTFVQTQHRLDETDALMEYVTPTGSATFLILPGFDADRPLGSTLP